MLCAACGHLFLIPDHLAHGNQHGGRRQVEYKDRDEGNCGGEPRLPDNEFRRVRTPEEMAGLHS